MGSLHIIVWFGLFFCHVMMRDMIDCGAAGVQAPLQRARVHTAQRVKATARLSIRGIHRRFVDGCLTFFCDSAARRPSVLQACPPQVRFGGDREGSPKTTKSEEIKARNGLLREAGVRVFWRGFV